MKNNTPLVLMAGFLLLFCFCEPAIAVLPLIDESNLQWGPEVNGIRIALQLVAVPNLNDVKSLPIDAHSYYPLWDAKWWPTTIVVYVKNSNNEGVSTIADRNGLEATFYSLNEQGKATPIEDDITKARNEATSGELFLVARPEGITIMKVNFPLDLLTQIKASMVMSVAFGTSRSISKSGSTFTQCLSAPVDIKQLNLAFLKSSTPSPSDAASKPNQ